jgi:hypothetical protein
LSNFPSFSKLVVSENVGSDFFHIYVSFESAFFIFQGSQQYLQLGPIWLHIKFRVVAVIFLQPCCNDFYVSKPIYQVESSSG